MVILNYVYTVKIFKIVYNASSSHGQKGGWEFFTCSTFSFLQRIWKLMSNFMI